MKEHTQSQRLIWFLDLINMDLSSINIGDKMKLTAEAIGISYGIASYVFLKDKSGGPHYDKLEDRKSISEAIDIWEKEKKLKYCQNHLKKYFQHIMERIDSWEEYTKEYKSALTNYFTLAEKRSTVTIKLETPAIEIEEPKVINKGKKDEHKAYRLKENSLLNSPIQLSIRGKDEKETLLLYFIQTLEGMPTRSLRQCPECGQYYLHLSQRKKIYCSNKCAARMGSRDKRRWIKDHNSDFYHRELAKGKERALKSYRKKQTLYVEKIPYLKRESGEKPKEKPKMISDQKLLPKPKSKKNK